MGEAGLVSCFYVMSRPLSLAQTTLVKQIWNILGISRIFLEMLQKRFLEVSRIYQFSFLENSRIF